MQATDPTPPRGPAGPDLLRKTAAAPGDDGRILARLEHGDAAFAPAPSLQRRRGRIAAAATVLTLLAGALAWTFYQNTSPRFDMRSLPPDMALRANGAASVPAPAPVAAVQPEATLAEPAAAIVNEAPVVPALATAPAKKAKTTPTVAAAATRSTASVAKAATTPATTPVKTARKADSRADDGDVALLTALVAHANNQTMPAPPDVAPPVSRDVVQGRAGETTEALLLRCQQLGLIEGMLCHSRICSGRWDSEPACK